MPRRPPAQLLALLAALALSSVFVSAPARGSPTYPPTIADHLGIMCSFGATGNQPPCIICHRDSSGGLGTVNRKFGQDLQALYGLTSQNPALLISALDQAKAMMLDSDGDGDTDIDALQHCRDPNQPASANIPPLEYGCGSITGRPRQITNTAAALLLGTMGILTVVRRRRRRASR
jgi:hypothetical protein